MQSKALSTTPVPGRLQKQIATGVELKTGRTKALSLPTTGSRRGQHGSCDRSSPGLPSRSRHHEPPPKSELRTDVPSYRQRPRSPLVGITMPPPVAPGHLQRGRPVSRSPHIRSQVAVQVRHDRTTRGRFSLSNILANVEGHAGLAGGLAPGD